MLSSDLPQMPQSRAETGVRYYSASELSGLPRSSPARKSWCIILVRNDELSFQVGEKADVCGKGLVVLPSENIPQRLAPREKFRGCAVSIPCDLILQMNIRRSFHFHPASLSSPYVPLEESEIKMLGNYMSIIKDSLDRPSSCQDAELFCVCKALMLRICSFIEVDDDCPSDVCWNPKVSEFIDMVRKDCASHRCLSYYADKICVCSKYLSRLVVKDTGRRANEWISDATISYAKKLLAGNRLPVESIAAALSFDSPSSFCRYFKQHTGLTPLQFRNHK